jgi:hypothetical protein
MSSAGFSTIDIAPGIRLQQANRERRRPDPRQECGEQPDCGQPRKDLEDELNAREVRELADQGSAHAAHPKREAEEQTGNRSDPKRHELLP